MIRPSRRVTGGSAVTTVRHHPPTASAAMLLSPGGTRGSGWKSRAPSVASRTALTSSLMSGNLPANCSWLETVFHALGRRKHRGRCCAASACLCSSCHRRHVMSTNYWPGFAAPSGCNCRPCPRRSCWTVCVSPSGYLPIPVHCSSPLLQISMSFITDSQFTI